VIIDVPEITLQSGICVIDVLFDVDFVGEFYLKFFNKFPSNVFLTKGESSTFTQYGEVSTYFLNENIRPKLLLTAGNELKTLSGISL